MMTFALPRRSSYILLLLFWVFTSCIAVIPTPTPSPNEFAVDATATPDPHDSGAPSAAMLAWQEEEVYFTNDDLQLAGTLTLPPGAGPHPAVIAITGSGPQDRNNATAEFADYQPYRELAEALAPLGIAMLRYDDRGVGGSTGDLTTATPAELQTDVVAALAYLQGRPEIDGARIALLGHSEGGVVAAMTAAAQAEVAAIVTLAAPAVPGREMQAAAMDRLIENSPTPELTAQLVEQEVQAMELTMAGDWQGLEEHIFQATLAQLELFPAEQRAALGDLEALARRQAEGAVTEVYQNPRYLFNLLYDPGDAWRQVTVPALALFAAADDVVLPELNRPALEAAWAEGGNRDGKVVVVVGVNHLFVPATEEAQPGDWTALSSTLAPAVREQVVTWLVERLGTVEVE
jgi:uncharacterized protein